MTDDRAASQQNNPNIPDDGLGDDLRSFLAKPVSDKPTRSRNLLPTFRVVPGDQVGAGPAPDPGFPGTRSFGAAFEAHRLDPGAAGRDSQSARERLDHASEVAPSSDDFARRGAAVLAAGPSASSDRPAVTAAEGGAGRRLRGRPAGSKARRGKKKQIEAGLPLPKAIAKLIPKDASGSSAPPRVLVPTETERADARRLFREIGERFNDNRKKSKTAAYSGYRHDLMANLDMLVMGGALDLKDATTIITNLEQYTKETEAESTETPA
ncbi:MAG TPA: hypothetical protein VMQ76_12285, partial [Terracidiphilus sp.]|nr:hypothetical protein [Terracidiphilus sp.]